MKSTAANAHMHRSFKVLPPSEGMDGNWHVTDSNDVVVAHCYGFDHSVVDGESLAYRIAAALNYCRGIPTGRLLANPGPPRPPLRVQNQLKAEYHHTHPGHRVASFDDIPPGVIRQWADRDELLSIPNIGKTGVKEVLEWLAEVGA